VARGPVDPVDLALVEARVGVGQTDDAASVRAWEALVERHGYEIATRAWLRACAEFDAAADTV
jgi:hypothetical protein